MKSEEMSLESTQKTNNGETSEEREVLIMEDDAMKISKDELENVSGGLPSGDEYITEESVEYCGGDYENGRHEWAKTGNHREDSFFYFWTKGLDEYRCTKCGATKWLSD